MNNNSLKVSLQLPSVHLYGLKIPNSQDSTETLENYVSQENLTNAERNNLLQQLGHCVLILHQKNITCGQLLKAPISVLKDLSPDVIAEFGKHNIKKQTKQEDINLLANLFCCILTSGKRTEYSEEIDVKDLKCSESDAHVALDILKKMADKYEPPNIEKILQHPLFWDDFRKVHFICKSVDFINDSGYRKGSKTIKESIVCEYSMGNETDVISKKGWIEKLKLTEDELEQFRMEHGSDPPVNEDLLYEKVSEQKIKEKSVFELALFFRNRYIHCREDGKSIRSWFRSYPSGYLNFFTERYPMLFQHVYNNLKTYLCTSNSIGEFAVNQSMIQPLRNIQFHIESCEKINKQQ